MVQTKRAEKQRSVNIKIAIPRQLFERIQEEAFEIGFSFQQYVRTILAHKVGLHHTERNKVDDTELELKTRFAKDSEDDEDDEDEE